MTNQNIGVDSSLEMFNSVTLFERFFLLHTFVVFCSYLNTESWVLNLFTPFVKIWNLVIIIVVLSVSS